MTAPEPPRPQPGTLRVDPQELIKRAKELANAMPQWPGDDPVAPCDLAMAKNAVTVLQRSVDNIRIALNAGQQRWRRLAQLFVDAAKEYKGVDEEAARTLKLTFESPPWSATLRPASPYRLQADPTGSFIAPVATPSWVGNLSNALTSQQDDIFLRLRPATTQINAGDPRAGALRQFAHSWESYEGKLRDAELVFKPIDSWDGPAATQVEKHLEQHQAWLRQMASNCTLITQQAKALASAHYVAVNNHPRPAEVEALYARLIAPKKSSRDAVAYQNLQKLSEEVRAEYRKQAGVPWQIVSPAMPPDRADANLLKSPEELAREREDAAQQRVTKHQEALLKKQEAALEKGQAAGRQLQEDALKRQEKAQREMTEALGKNLAKSTGAKGLPIPSPAKLIGTANQLANMAKGMGPKPTPPGFHPPGLPQMPPIPLGGHPSQVHPAASPGAAAGGALGGGGAGAPPRWQPPLLPPTTPQPSTPLQTPRGQISMDPESLSRLAAASGQQGTGSGSPTHGAGTGGAGAMGGLGGGQAQPGGKVKRVQPDDPALYTEERPWTEGVVGLRSRKIEPPAPPPPPDAAG